jgi:hypothetical protein
MPVPPHRTRKWGVPLLCSAFFDPSGLKIQPKRAICTITRKPLSRMCFHHRYLQNRYVPQENRNKSGTTGLCRGCSAYAPLRGRCGTSAPEQRPRNRPSGTPAQSPDLARGRPVLYLPPGCLLRTPKQEKLLHPCPTHGRPPPRRGWWRFYPPLANQGILPHLLRQERPRLNP